MAVYTTIDDPSEYFHIQTWTGTADDSTKVITNDANAGNFKPDWLWIKSRSGNYEDRDHALYDSSRGQTKRLESSATDTEATDSNNTFNTNGFTLTANYSINGPSTTYVGWQWKCNGGTTTSHSSGSNGAEVASVYQVNDTAGFSIGTYTGAGGNNVAVYTGLSAACEAVIVKNRDATTDWAVGFSEKISTAAARYFSLNNTDQAQSVGPNSGERQQGAINVNNFGAGLFDITTGGAGDNDVFQDGEKYVFYAFRSIQGYSKFGKYKGNGNTDGAFVYTGFKPAWLMVKKIEDNNRSWVIHDNKQDPHNVTANRLDADKTQAQQSSGHFDFLSNGFKCRSTEGATNQNSNTFVYLAFAEHPFVSSKGTPTTAR
tara:strand:- start:6 stop:1124 length:1119 start_codon:yes stop_codon:yes gene_type:complete